MTAPLATLLITAWQHERYIGRAVESALAQTYSPLEIVVSDDCSADGTFREAERAAAGYRGPHRVILHRQPERLGPFGNGHYWFRRFRGDFLIFNDADDWSHPERVEKMMAVRRETGASVITCNCVYVDESGGRALKYHRDPAEPQDDSLEYVCLNGTGPCCFGAGMGFGREVIDTFGVTPDWLTAGDIVLPFWGGLLGGLRFMPEPLVMYRVHGGNSSIGRQMEQAEGVARLAYEERCHYGHAAHSVFMLQSLEAFAAERPDRAALADRLKPLLFTALATQTVRWTRARQALDAEGVKYVGGALSLASLKPAA